MDHQTSMFTHETKIPRSPFASTLTLVFHVALGLAVVIVTAIPSIPKEHRNESLTFMRAVALPEPFDVPPAPVPVPKPVVEIPRPEPPKAFEAPAIVKPAPVPTPPPPAPEKKAIEPPREVLPPKHAVNVGAFADVPAPNRVERKAQVETADFGAPATETARTRRELQALDAFENPATRTTAARAAVSDAGFGGTTATSNAPRATVSAGAAGFSADMTPKPAASAPRATGAAGFVADTTPRPAPAPPKPVTQPASFTDTPAAPKLAPQAPPPPRADRPVEVVYKPSPAYTDEARAKHVEGEVTLEVEFTAEGQVRVLRVVRGLGYGLDEMAQRAAEQIRFKPATSKGSPVDFRANLTIVFRLT